MSAPINYCLLILMCITGMCKANSIKRAYLVKNDKRIYIEQGWVGFTTQADTIEFQGEGLLSYEIVNITTDSITIRRPEVYTDRAVPYNGQYPEYMPENPIQGRQFREKGKKYKHVVSVQQYEYRSHALKDITTFQYPSKVDERDIGCMGCVLGMLVPGVNVYLYNKLRKRWHPSNYKMIDGWHFEIKEIY